MELLQGEPGEEGAEVCAPRSFFTAPAQGAAPAELDPEGDGAADGAALRGFRQE